MNGTSVRLEFDKQKLNELMEMLQGHQDAYRRVIKNALNRAALTMRSRVTHDAADKMEMKLKDLKSRVHYKPASEDRLIAIVYIDDKGFSLWFYKPVQNRMGVTTTKGVRMSIPHAFIAEIRKNQEHPNVYLRASNSKDFFPKGDPRRGRFPVLTQYGPGMVEVIAETGGWEKHYAEALDVLDQRLRFETERIFAGGKASAVKSYLTEDWKSWRSRMGVEEFV